MLSFVVLIFIALLLPGVINRTRAVLSGRKGVTLWQHVLTLGVSFRKGAVYSPVAGTVFRMAPVVGLGATLTAAAMVPVGPSGALISFGGDVVLFCYLLALGRMMLILGALDTGSSFEGMGASREALYGALVEPALFIVLGTLALVSGHTSFARIFTHMESGSPEMIIAMIPLMYAVTKILIVEAGRIPVDDPRTHLELTMIHEVMVLDYCGFDMGLITLSSWIKTAAFAVIASSALVATFGYGIPLVVLLCIVIGLGIGTIESFMARGRLFDNTTYIVTISAIAFVVFIVAFLILRNIHIG